MINRIDSQLPTIATLSKQTNNKEKVDFDTLLIKEQKSLEQVELKKACADIEHYMLQQVFEQMKASTKISDGILEKGIYEKTFASMYAQALTGEMMKAGGVGLTEMMLTNLKRN